MPQRVTALALLVAIGAACSGSGHSRATTHASNPCPLITKLNAIAAGVRHADVSDPDDFPRTLDRAVNEYAATLGSLRKWVPESIRPDLDQVAADVRQFRFDAARADQSSLIDYARTQCGSASTPSTIAG